MLLSWLHCEEQGTSGRAMQQFSPNSFVSVSIVPDDQVVAVANSETSTHTVEKNG
jgi:hypothetical protein